MALKTADSKTVKTSPFSIAPLRQDPTAKITSSAAGPVNIAPTVANPNKQLV